MSQNREYKKAKAEYGCWTVVLGIIILAMLAALTAGYGLIIAVPVTVIFIVCGNAAGGMFGG